MLLPALWVVRVGRVSEDEVCGEGDGACGVSVARVVGEGAFVIVGRAGGKGVSTGFGTRDAGYD